MVIGDGEPAVAVTRDGVVESLHRAHVVLAHSDGRRIAVLGDGQTMIYPRSSLKPLQAMALADLIARSGASMSVEHLALASASHSGSDTHQIVAASMLAEAGLDETALQCPPAWPADEQVRQSLSARTTLSHNCSGKHAAMIWASVAAGFDPARYLATDGPLQGHVAARVEREIGERLGGPGVDGCGAPAWRCSLQGLATGFATLAAGEGPGVADVRDAMVSQPLLVGGHDLPDTALMGADDRVVAKRGADGVLGCGFRASGSATIGLALKVEDGADRAAGPLAAAVLHALGAVVPAELLRVPVLGGSAPHGEIRACATVTDRVHGHR